MVIRKLKEVGVTSDVAYGAALASIILSIGIWASRKGKDAAYAERFGIFVGLWAPTFAILGSALQEEE
jgi:hypothetical protein